MITFPIYTTRDHKLVCEALEDYAVAIRDSEAGGEIAQLAIDQDQGQELAERVESLARRLRAA